MKRKTGEKQKIRVSSRDQCELFKAKLDSCGAVRDAIKLAHRSNLINRNLLTTSSLFSFLKRKIQRIFCFIPNWTIRIKISFHSVSGTTFRCLFSFFWRNFFLRLLLLFKKKVIALIFNVLNITYKTVSPINWSVFFNCAIFSIECVRTCVTFQLFWAVVIIKKSV